MASKALTSFEAAKLPSVKYPAKKRFKLQDLNAKLHKEQSHDVQAKSSYRTWLNCFTHICMIIYAIIVIGIFQNWDEYCELRAIVPQLHLCTVVVLVSRGILLLQPCFKYFCTVTCYPECMSFFDCLAIVTHLISIVYSCIGLAELYAGEDYSKNVSDYEKFRGVTTAMQWLFWLSIVLIIFLAISFINNCLLAFVLG